MVSLPLPRCCKIRGSCGMPARYAIDKEKRLVIMTGWERVVFDDVTAIQDQLLNDPDLNPTNVVRL